MRQKDSARPLEGLCAFDGSDQDSSRCACSEVHGLASWGHLEELLTIKLGLGHRHHVVLVLVQSKKTLESDIKTVPD